MILLFPAIEQMNKEDGQWLSIKLNTYLENNFYFIL